MLHLPRARVKRTTARTSIVHRSALSVVVLNRFPYNNGHLLVGPKAHKGQLDELTTDELLDLQHAAAADGRRDSRSG